MLLLTGATGLIGSAVVRRLTAAGRPVRCLVRDPRRLGEERVRVQIVLGDLADPPSFRNALRGVRTVVHLAGSARDQPGGSIEELNGIATWRMVEAARRAGVEHFVFCSAQGASTHSRARLLRAKAVAERAIAEAGVPHTIVALSLAYAPGATFLAMIDHLALLLPVVPVSGRGRAEFQPIWAEDAAAGIAAVVEREPPGQAARVELSGPQTLSHSEVVATALRARGHPRRLWHVPSPLVRGSLRLAETLMKSKAPVTWDEAELLEVSMTSARGTADARALGVEPRPMADVLQRPVGA
jgi:NADH dehydrogenase